jgi:Gpi18-like mannosyltransferase
MQMTSSRSSITEFLSFSRYIKNQKFYWICVFVIILCASFFSFYKLGSTIMNVDAQHWYSRSQQFVNSLNKLNFQGTYQDPKPGVTVMWLSGLSLECFLTLYNWKYGFRPFLYTSDTFPLIQFSAIAPLVILNLASLIVFAYIGKELFGKRVTLISLVLISLHPFYLGNSRFLHVDITLSVFMSLAYLSSLLWNKNKNIKSLVASAIFFALALLTKTQAIILFPLISVLFISNRKYKDYLIWIFIVCVTFFIIFPAMWVEPTKVLTNIYSEAFHVAQTGNTSRQESLYYFTSLPKIYSLPLFLLSIAGMIITTIGVIKQTNQKNSHQISLVGVTVFIVMYLLVMCLVKQKIDRYMLPLFPFLVIQSANAILLIGKKISYSYLLLGTFLLVLINTIYYAPYYEVFGMDSMKTNYYGSLYNEVGKYLNSKEKPANQRVVAMTKAYSLKPFIKGKVFGHEESEAKNGKIDYLVTNNYWLEKYGKPSFFDLCNLEKTIELKGQVFWNIYKCDVPAKK